MFSVNKSLILSARDRIKKQPIDQQKYASPIKVNLDKVNLFLCWYNCNVYLPLRPTVVFTSWNGIYVVENIDLS